MFDSMDECTTFYELRNMLAIPVPVPSAAASSFRQELGMDKNGFESMNPGFTIDHQVSRPNAVA